MKRRIGFVGIILESKENVAEINQVISDHSELVLARVGLPMKGADTAGVITLVVEATTDEMGAFAGRLGKIKGISVKSALAKQREPEKTA